MSILAAKSYFPGDIICVEKPFVKVLHHEWWDKVCSGCCIKSTGLKKCGGCKKMKYCGINCQKNDWPDHKFECHYVRNYTNFTNEDIVYLIGKLILKLKGKDWKTAKSRVLNLEVSFDDLLSHSDCEIQNSSFDHQNISNTLESFIGKENMPDRKTLLELFGKVITNTFGFYCGEYPYGNAFDTLPREKDNDGSAICLGVSKIDHSCVPNAVFHVNGVSITVRALRAIKKSEKK
ncbi:hypothetical protein JTE90_022061 [Oedothorax gibbosus]|uniref:MYND-type domain-containing protein n=1 Tax=Oedothorax gibbosus TaxID=931172 RepID=A0AAV6TZ55_9ARAC|nr:hypothetical protein JTE90_022061 [Oedothorax gibbosus]